MLVDLAAELAGGDGHAFGAVAGEERFEPPHGRAHDLAEEAGIGRPVVRAGPRAAGLAPAVVLGRVRPVEDGEYRRVPGFVDVAGAVVVVRRVIARGVERGERFDHDRRRLRRAVLHAAAGHHDLFHGRVEPRGERRVRRVEGVRLAARVDPLDAQVLGDRGFHGVTPPVRGGSWRPPGAVVPRAAGSGAAGRAGSGGRNRVGDQ
nr:hypothetical protein [Amycolatopsis sp. FDAARGOS 1241]